MEILPFFLISLFFVELSIVCYTDIKYRLISNKLVFMIAVTSILYGYFFNENINFLSAFIFLLIGFFIFVLGLMGGGDIKLITALILGLNHLQILNFIFYTSICGLLVLLLGMLISFSDIKKRGIPYGVAIALGFLLSITY
ncbi:tight adherance operon protein [Candidatus Williamhamiltonella defendens]|nr:prepilin peptidase [Candidatus Hamiltonella defensa]AYB48500.1 tight adherance operon protein [Candidatus Hamiltonella defensa]